MTLLAMAVGAGPANAEFVSNSYATFSGDRVGVMADGDFYYDVDGEGEMVVTAADGWLVNGSESVTVYRDRNRGQCLGFQSKLGEGSEGCHVFPHSVLGDVHKAGEAVSISAWTPSAAYTAVYAAPDDVAKVAAPVYSEVEKKGLHVETREWKRPCSCGTYPAFETDVREYEVVPDVFVKRVRVGREASSRDVSEGRVSLLKGENQHLEYTVAASRKASPECALCAATASAEALADVYELSVSMESEYLGLDMTDAARGHQVSRTATARIDPNPKSGNHAVYRWTDCGTRCEWSSSLSASTVKYRTDGSKGPSSRYREEPLVVEGTVYTQNWLGPKVSAACTNRFTIVKVDVELEGTEEGADEKNHVLVPCEYVNQEGEVQESVVTRLVPVKVSVSPGDLKPNEPVRLCFADFFCYVDEDAVGEAKGSYLAGEFPKTFYVKGRNASAKALDKALAVEIPAAKATDLAKCTCYTLKFITPAGDPVQKPKDSGAGKNEFTFGDANSHDADAGAVIALKSKVLPSGLLELFSSGDERDDDSSGEEGGSDSDIRGRFVVPEINGTSLSWGDVWGDSPELSSTGVFEAAAWYDGYPISNSDFGKKEASFSWMDMTIKTPFEVFFEKKGHGHPSCAECPDCPNWFYYWKEGSVCSIPKDATYKPDPRRYGSWSKKNGLVLYDLAAETDTETKVSADICITNWSYAVNQKEIGDGLAMITKKSVGTVGMMYYVTSNIASVVKYRKELTIGHNLAGIGCVAATVKHELGHCDMNEILAASDWLRKQRDVAYYNTDNESGAVVEFGSDSLEAAVAKELCYEYEDKYGDKDPQDRLCSGDHVSDGMERDGDGGCWSNVFDPDTYGLALEIGCEYGEYGDEEVRMRLLENGDLSDMYSESLDWANPGCQVAGPFGPINKED